MERLGDIEQIKQLKAKYCYYVDEYFEDPANLGRLMHEVFTDDTELDFETVGTAKGRAETEAFFVNVVFRTLAALRRRRARWILIFAVGNDVPQTAAVSSAVRP
jgi:hypothetical protein